MTSNEYQAGSGTFSSVHKCLRRVGPKELTLYNILNDIITLTDLCKNTENCPNNRSVNLKTFFHNSLVNLLKIEGRICITEQARSVKQEYLVYDLFFFKKTFLKINKK